MHGEWYGTPLGPVEEALASGRDVVLQIDVQGAQAVREIAPDAVTIFLEPPSWEVLEARLRARGTEADEKVRVRLETARREMALRDSFEHRVVNDDLDRAVAEVARIIVEARKGDAT